MTCLALLLPAATKPWEDIFAELMPELELVIWPNIPDPEKVDAVYAWRPEPGALSRFPNLKVIFSLGAGAEKILDVEDLPEGVPISRVVDPEMTQRMREFVALSVLALHRRWPEMIANQRKAIWRGMIPPPATARKVGLLGMGQLGTACGRTLRDLGFIVMGWASRAGEREGLPVVAGDDGLAALLGESDILVNLLPSTPATRKLLDASLFARMKRGAGLVNAARGDQLVEADLISALDSGQVGGAVLDVFEKEPLAAGNPLWRHPRVVVSPHVASVVSRRRRAELVVQGLRALIAGEEIPHQVDPARGY